MKSFSRFFRLTRISFILVRYNLDEFIFGITWFYPLRFLKYFNPWYWLLRKRMTRAERLRCALVELGPIFIKAGQLLSTRRDLLPDDIATELEKLQDRVPPFPAAVAKQIIADSLGTEWRHAFTEFSDIPLASASIAQVHAATLINGKKVVIKVLRPEIRKIIDRDIDLLFTLARLAQKHHREARRFKPIEMVSEIAATLHDELDLQREGANASQLRRNFKYSDLLYIPEIEWAYSKNNVLVLERIEGIPIHQTETLRAAGFDMKKLAERGVEIFFTQVFRDSFFHADMHPGNIFANIKDPANPSYIAVDFGIVGSLNTRDQRYLAENMLAFFKRDYQRVAELHVASGWLAPTTRIDQFEGAIRAVCEPIFERPLRDISFGQLLLRLFQTARRFEMNIQPQLILLQKTLMNIEGVGRQLYPDLDLWKTAAPFLENWLKKQIGTKAFFRKVKQNIPYWAEKMPEVPGLIYDILQKTQASNEKNHFPTQQFIRNKTATTSISFFGRISWFLMGSITMFALICAIFWLIV